MNREQRAHQLAEQALTLPPEMIALFVSDECGDDVELRTLVVSMLGAELAASGLAARLSQSGRTRDNERQLSLESLMRIDEICRQFEQAYNSGGAHLSIADALKDVDSTERGHLLTELVLLEVDYRSRQGDRPTRDEYLAVFPHYKHAIEAAYSRIAKSEQRKQQDQMDLGDRYEILSTVGAGGMGKVYHAIDTRLGREVAIKVVNLGRHDDEELKERFAREMRAVATLSHPNIVSLFDYAEHRGTSFAVMEFIKGRTLRQKVSDGMSCQEAIDVVAGIAAALEAAHARNIMHRDIKPDNVIVSADGAVKVVDFGLARQESLPTEQELTATAMVPGTFPYMSPEQANGAEVTCATDIFSLGTVLYEMLTGTNPFRASSVPRTLQNVSAANPPPLSDFVKDVPQQLASLTRAMLHSNPDQRPTAKQVAEAVNLICDSRATYGTDSSSFKKPYDSSTLVATSVPTNLSLRPARLTGRQQVIAEVSNRLVDHSIVTIVGPGGVGKTSVAMEVARRNLEEYPGGVWFCDFASLRKSDDVAEVVAAVLDGHAGASCDLNELVERLVGPPTMLVFDNCEHLIDAAADLAELLVRRVANLTILTTSREMLDVSTEYVFRLDGVPCVGPASDAARLFAARADAVAGYKSCADSQALVERIVSKLEGLPLAIELAASKLSAMSLEELLQSLDDPDWIGGRRRRSQGRQGTMERAIAWSFDLLDGSEQDVLLALSVFGSWFTSEAASEICEAKVHAGSCLRRLVEQSVIIRKETKGKSQYRLLEPIRQFCQARIDAEANARARKRHAYFYAQRAAALGRGISGENELACLDALNAEWSDIRIALAWGRENKVIEVAVDSIIPMARTIFFQMRTEAYQWLQAAMSVFGSKITARADVNWLSALASYATGDDEQAADYLRRSEAIAFTSQAAWVWYVVLCAEGRLDEAIDAFDRGRKLAEESGDPLELRWFRCSAMLVTALALRNAADPRVDHELKASTEFLSRHDWPTGESMVCVGQMTVAIQRGKLALAADYNRRAAEIATASGNLSLLAATTFVASGLEDQSKNAPERLLTAIGYLRSNIEKGDKKHLTLAVRSIIIGLVDCGHLEIAARCSAILKRHSRTRYTNSLTPRYLPTLNRLRKTLGETEFKRLQQDGAELTEQDIVELAEQALKSTGG